jgi:pimeloyl-ACP methyl ester carboxylesterase
VSAFVIVHGAWGGGWEWTPVARHLRAAGHDVITPTLTGMGERAHLAHNQTVSLAMHVEDIVAVLEFENLHDVVLCGASYGGMPVTAAADHAAERIRLVIYVDALVPLAGQAAVDLLPAPFGEMVRAGIEAHGPHWRVPMPSELLDALIPVGSITERARADYVSRVRDHPAATFIEPALFGGAVDRLRRAFVRCTTSDFGTELGGDPIEICARRAQAEGWLYRELATPHDPQIFDPAGIAAILEELAQ